MEIDDNRGSRRTRFVEFALPESPPFFYMHDSLYCGVLEFVSMQNPACTAFLTQNSKVVNFFYCPILRIIRRTGL